jgi:RimJ/RimL family protein N-acetyltransferase
MTIRPLCEADWEALREIRLLALRTEPGVFFAAYADEAALPDERWRTLARGGDFAIFGLFDAERLVGITGAFVHRDDPSGSTAVLGMSYLFPEYRGRGFASLYYETRLAWIRNQPRFARVAVSHRHSNERSGRAIARHGFRKVGVTSRSWPDGAVEDEVNYELLLTPNS